MIRPQGFENFAAEPNLAPEIQGVFSDVVSRLSFLDPFRSAEAADSSLALSCSERLHTLQISANGGSPQRLHVVSGAL